MERKIGETFVYEGKKLQVKESERISCYGCFFDEQCLPLRKEVAGECEFEYRTDNKEVIFVEATEQPQEQAEQQTEQPQNINLCEILKYCPEGEPLWSPMLGDVKFYGTNQSRKFVNVILENRETWDINADGTITIGTTTSPEIMLYPSLEQRDWTKVKYEKKKEKFDPKTLSPFDRVLGRNHGSHRWTCDLFSDIIDGDECMYHCIGSYYRYCIPYNDDTKHLLDTKEEAPVFYRYWED